MRNRLIIVMALAVCAFGASAQNTDIEALSGLNFSFGNPGARALGMGGAFLGMADDSSAAEANPAGLTALVRPELTMEIRNSKTLQTLAVDGEYDPADPSGIIYQDFTSYSRRAEIAFGSFVIPRGNWRIAGYYHSALEYENEANALYEVNRFGQVRVHDTRFYLGPNGPVNYDSCVALGSDCTGYRLFPYYTGVNVDLETWGLAVAYKVSDNFSIGGAYKKQKFTEEALTFRTDFSLTPLAFLAQTADDEDYSYSIGFKLGSPRSKFNLGGVYKTGGSFDTGVFLGTFDQNFNITSLEQTSAPKFNVPDVYGIGISYNPMPPLRINVDAVQVNYSDLVDDMQSVYNGVKEDPQYKREDVTEIHVGAEWFFVNSRVPWALRAGWWQDPEHALKWAGPVTNPGQGSVNILFPEGEDRDHYSIGIGIAFTKIQLDAAYDTSDKRKVGSISAKYVF
ncbi:MAG: outer membrane protein transport protein [Thermoanaerobaculia bacterium]